MSLQRQPEYEKLFLEICDGKSPVLGKAFWIKHLGMRDTALIAAFKKKTEAKLKAGGARSEKEILVDIIASGAWSEEEEKALGLKRQEYDGVSKSLPKLTNPRDKAKIQEHLKTIDLDIQTRVRKRNKYIGNTLESSAANLAAEYQVCLTMIDKSSNPIISWEEWEEFTEDESQPYIVAYNKHMSEYNYKDLSNIGFQMFFWTVFQNYPVDCPYLLWNKSVQDITNYQSLVGERAKRIRKIFENNSNIPDSASNDYEELVKWVTGAQKDVKAEPADAKRMLAKNKGKNVSLLENPDSFT